jgi:hypothetical protein
VRIFSLTFIAVALLVACGAAHADISPGEWQMSTTVELPGMSSAFGPFTQTECLSATQAKDPGRLFAAPGGPAAGCAFTNQNDDGSTFSFDLSCGGTTPVSGSGSVRYGADSVDGELKLRSEFGGQLLETRFRISAHRIGPCGK